MVFRWKKCGTKRRILIERADIVYWRCRYLQSLKKFREGREIFYLDETWVDSSLTFKKCWQGDEVDGVMTTRITSHRLIVMHIGSSNGFLEGAGLVFRAGTVSGDYHGQMNADNFEKWLSEIVIPKLPPTSVLVMDNAPYHGRQVDKPPSASALKKEMIDWLERHGVQCDTSARKGVLYTIINSMKPKQKTFRVDKLLESHGHSVVRLPPYMCELSPIELVWAKLKRHVRSRNTTGDTSTIRIEELVMEGLNVITATDWLGFS
jgi:transposase